MKQTLSFDALRLRLAIPAPAQTLVSPAARADEFEAACRKAIADAGSAR